MKYRTVPASLWTDPGFRNLPPHQKLTLLHLITGPHSNVSGLFCLPLLYIAHETGLTDQEARQAIDGLVAVGFVRWHGPTETIWAVGMLGYQGSSPKILRAVADQVESLPSSPVVDAFRAHYAHLQIPYRYPIDRVSSKDKEKEKEEEHAEDGDLAAPPLETAEDIPYADIIAYLNEKTGKCFRATTAAYRTCIHARWREGARLEDFRTVIDNMIRQWKDKPEMQVYLRPQTLFGPKFESYLNSQAAHAAPTGEAYQPFKEEVDDYQVSPPECSPGS